MKLTKSNNQSLQTQIKNYSLLQKNNFKTKQSILYWIIKVWFPSCNWGPHPIFTVELRLNKKTISTFI